MGPWRETAPALRARWGIMRELPQVHLLGTASLTALSVALGLQTTALTIANGFVVGSLAGAIGNGFRSPEGRGLVVALTAMAIFFALGQVLPTVQQRLSHWLGQRLDLVLRTRMLEAAAAPSGITHLEDPAFVDALDQAQGMGAWFTPGVVVEGVSGLLATRVGAVGSVVLVASFNPLIAALLVCVAMFVGAHRRKRYLVLGSVVYGQTERMRRSDYHIDLALGGAPKEIRIFGLGGWIRERFSAHFLEAMSGVWKERWAQDRYHIWSVPLRVFSNMLAFWLVARAGLRGSIGLAEVTILATAIFGIEPIAGNSSIETTMAEYGSQAYPKVLEVEQRSRRAVVPRGPRDPGKAPRSTIRIEDLRFRYPGSKTDIYDGLDLEIPAGHSLAIVGSNGAGKTTLVKLLARLYEPTGGRILIDGTNLSEFDPRLWQRRIAAIFQDFATYSMSAKENVGLGSIERVDDADALERAARSAGASSIIEGLPQGWDTVLSRSFTAGAELSGGQWQRIALARALFAVDGGAGVLILDEPTASLDVRAEAELFDRYLDLTRGVTTILISHRFSTVRHAERICVIDEGRISEQGSHEQLMQLNGRYAHMFRLQAARFAETGQEASDA